MAITERGLLLGTSSISQNRESLFRRDDYSRRLRPSSYYMNASFVSDWHSFPNKTSHGGSYMKGLVCGGTTPLMSTLIWKVILDRVPESLCAKPFLFCFQFLRQEVELWWLPLSTIVAPFGLCFSVTGSPSRSLPSLCQVSLAVYHKKKACKMHQLPRGSSLSLFQIFLAVNYSKIVHPFPSISLCRHILDWVNVCKMWNIGTGDQIIHQGCIKPESSS